MEALSRQHCLNHALREAVARCPECRMFFCRECISEHDDRVICAGCLKKIAAAQRGPRASRAILSKAVLCVTGIVTAWLFFFWTGKILLSIPTSFHDGTVWQTEFWNE